MNIKQQIIDTLRPILRDLSGQDIDPVLEHPPLLTHGDYSSNIAMAVFSREKGKGKRGKGTSPLELAEELATKLQSEQAIKKLCGRVEAVPPGFINFYLAQQALTGELETALEAGENYGRPPLGTTRGSLLVDFSHPNIAKRFGVGHLRSTIIGQAIINLYRFLGWEVIADNFLGDWGTQFGMIIAQVKNKNLEPKSLTINELEELYVEFNQKAQQDPKLMEEARLWFKKLEDGDREAREIWQAVRQVSLEEFKRVWDLLGVEFDYVHGESFFEDKMEEVIEDAQKAGIAKWDKGALIVPLEGFEAPLMLLKSDGATTYEARDLAAVKFWMSEFKPDRIVYEVGVDQDLHFRQFFKVAEMLGYVEAPRDKQSLLLRSKSPQDLRPGSFGAEIRRSEFPSLHPSVDSPWVSRRRTKKGQLVHVKHGLYRLESGKMRTRAGQTVKLELVLDEAIERAKRLAEGKGERGKGKLAGEVAQAVGIGAVKYFDLSHHPSTDIIFDWERIFALEGNSAPYLQYTHARCTSVLARAKGEAESESSPLTLNALPLNNEELAILRYFYRFPEVVEEAASGYSPNLLCNFLFELAQRYNTFYSKHRILEDAKRNTEHGTRESNRFSYHVSRITSFRLALTAATANILKTGLGLLGIGAPSKM